MNTTNHCHYHSGHSYCDATIPTMAATLNNHIADDEVHLTKEDRSKLEDIDSVKTKLDGIDLSSYVLESKLQDAIDEQLSDKNYISEIIPNTYATESALNLIKVNVELLLSTIRASLNNDYYTKDFIDNILGEAGNIEKLYNVEFDVSTRTLTLIMTNGKSITTYIPGTAGETAITKFVYKSSNIAPDAPEGGSFDFKLNLFIPPTGWKESSSGLTGDIYMSQKIFSSNPEVDNKWSTPTKITGTVTNTTVIEKEVSASHVIIVYNIGIIKDAGPAGSKYSISVAPSAPVGGLFDFSEKKLTQVPDKGDPEKEALLPNWSIEPPSLSFVDINNNNVETPYTVYFSIGTIGEGDAPTDIKWSTPAIFGTDYLFVASNIKNVAINYSILADNITLSSNELTAIADNISANAENLEIISSNIDIQADTIQEIISDENGNFIKKVTEIVDNSSTALSTTINGRIDGVESQIANIEIDKDGIAAEIENKLSVKSDFIELIANKVSVDSEATTFTGDVNAKSFSLGETDEGGEFIPKVKFVKNAYFDKDGIGRKYIDTVDPNVYVLICYDDNNNPAFVSSLLSLTDSQSSTNVIFYTYTLDDNNHITKADVLNLELSANIYYSNYYGTDSTSNITYDNTSKFNNREYDCTLGSRTSITLTDSDIYTSIRIDEGDSGYANGGEIFYTDPNVVITCDKQYYVHTAYAKLIENGSLSSTEVELTNIYSAQGKSAYILKEAQKQFLSVPTGNERNILFTINNGYTMNRAALALKNLCIVHSENVGLDFCDSVRNTSADHNVFRRFAGLFLRTFFPNVQETNYYPYTWLNNIINTEGSVYELCSSADTMNLSNSDIDVLKNIKWSIYNTFVNATFVPLNINEE